MTRRSFEMFMYRLMIMKPRRWMFVDDTWTKIRSPKLIPFSDAWFKISWTLWHWTIYKPLDFVFGPMKVR